MVRILVDGQVLELDEKDERVKEVLQQVRQAQREFQANLELELAWSAIRKMGKEVKRVYASLPREERLALDSRTWSITFAERVRDGFGGQALRNKAGKEEEEE